jgi:hypothetical protein
MMASVTAAPFAAFRSHANTATGRDRHGGDQYHAVYRRAVGIADHLHDLGFPHGAAGVSARDGLHACMSRKARPPRSHENRAVHHAGRRVFHRDQVRPSADALRRTSKVSERAARASSLDHRRCAGALRARHSSARCRESGEHLRRQLHHPAVRYPTGLEFGPGV